MPVPSVSPARHFAGSRAGVTLAYPVGQCCVSLCSRPRVVSHTPQLACIRTLSCPGPTGRGSRRGPRSTSTLRKAGAPGWCLGDEGGGGGCLSRWGRGGVQRGARPTHRNEN